MRLESISRLLNYSRSGDVSAKLSIFLKYIVTSRLLLLVFASKRRTCINCIHRQVSAISALGSGIAIQHPCNTQ